MPDCRIQNSELFSHSICNLLIQKQSRQLSQKLSLAAQSLIILRVAGLLLSPAARFVYNHRLTCQVDERYTLLTYRAD